MTHFAKPSRKSAQHSLHSFNHAMFLLKILQALQNPASLILKILPARFEIALYLLSNRTSWKSHFRTQRAALTSTLSGLICGLFGLYRLLELCIQKLPCLPYYVCESMQNYSLTSAFTAMRLVALAHNQVRQRMQILTLSRRSIFEFVHDVDVDIADA